MFDTVNTAQIRPPKDDTPSNLDRFVDSHQDALYDAAALLAGGRGIHLVDRIVDGMSDQEGPTSRTIRALHDLFDILALENVDDLTRPEAHFFLAIDPSEPIVDDICLLTDELATIISDMDTAAEQQSSDGRAAA
ncbi:hypothetical protein [Sulfitobacter sabulilitoris]|uniref:Uncharacterized protein n=1 Tax=Sulfitobacter sabulilitoris TaxID=2562655 RepID=A0A5S3PIC6_9RHOB|nr:hypothetical protein [Sulfitobacter sabulilitoris]TMM54109.1 hypothetical protein FDT80_00450 [Sulfitobacter sabulilitoris]